jgi:putative spermidine/putrescine transport system substrate-binding protein
MRRALSLIPLSLALTVAVFGLARAQESVTVVSFGGTYQDSERKAFYEPTAKALGIVIKEDSLKGYADVRLQVQGGKPTWDVVELGSQYCQIGQTEGMFEPLDFAVVTSAKDLDPRFKGQDWVAGPTVYSMVLAWNTAKYGNNLPSDWKDFFDTKKFPGNRALYNQARFTLELALLADGVPPEKLYPLDVSRAITKLRSIKKQVTSFYTSHGQSVQLVKDGEIDMAAMLNGRVVSAIGDGAKWSYTFSQGIMDYGCFAIPKGAPHKTLAMKVINEFISPDLQANLPKYFSYGPVNPKAFETGKISPQERTAIPSAPENVKRQVLFDTAWWVANEKMVQPLWDEFLQE